MKLKDAAEILEKFLILKERLDYFKEQGDDSDLVKDLSIVSEELAAAKVIDEELLICIEHFNKKEDLILSHNQG